MSTGELVARWAVAFVVTQLVECPVYVRAFRVPPRVAFGASAVTHPIVCFAIPALWESAYLEIVRGHPERALSPTAYFVAYGAIAETFAIVVEAIWVARLGRLPWRRACWASLFSNGASALVGLMCSWATGWP